MSEGIERRDIEALLATRRELGAEYDDALVAAFAERVERSIQRRDDGAVSERDARQQAQDRGAEGGRIRQFVLGLVSLGAGIPITIVPTVSNAENGIVAVALAWLGIAGVNAAHAAAVNGRRRG